MNIHGLRGHATDFFPVESAILNEGLTLDSQDGLRLTLREVCIYLVSKIQTYGLWPCETE